VLVPDAEGGEVDSGVEAICLTADPRGEEFLVAEFP